MKEQGDHGENQKQVNEKTRYVIDEESAGPEQEQDHKQCKKRADPHSGNSPLVLFRGGTGHSIIAGALGA
jgi:hypothetical protein